MNCERNRTQRNQRSKRAFINLAKSFPCLDCSSSFPPSLMHFDHVRGEKLFTLGSQGASRNLSAIRDEIAKCELRCYACHVARHDAIMPAA